MPRTCTNGQWCVSTTSGTNIDGYEISVFIPRRSFPYLAQRGDLNGLTVKTKEEADRLLLERGYLRPYNRNLGEFKMSRAARKRGMKCEDIFYQMRVKSAEGIVERKKAMRNVIRLRDLKIDDLFNFVDSPNDVEPYIYNGNGWYCNMSGYAGGPWHQYDNPPVYRVNEANERLD